MALLLLALALGCESQAQSTYGTSNVAVAVDLLFEHDGCRVYRFGDEGRNHYYVRCADGQSTISQKNCGKNCWRPEEIPTVTDGQTGTK